MGDETPSIRAMLATWRRIAFDGSWDERERLVHELTTLLLRFASVAILGVAFFALGDTVVEDGRDRFDNRVARFAHDLVDPSRTRFMRWGSDVASASVVVPLMLLLCGLLVWRGRRKEAELVAVAWILGQALHLTLKLVYHRPRPSLYPRLTSVSGYSFPSGHTVTAVMTYGLLAVVIARAIPKGWRWLPWTLAALIVAWVAASRVYLGAHFATDVLGSMLIAGAWLRFCVLAVRHFAPARGGE